MTVDTNAGSPASESNAAVSTSTQAATVVRSEEHLSTRTVSLPSERVTIRKVIVSEERTITVTVHREELRIARSDIGPTDENDPRNAVPASARDFSMILSEERAEVVMTVVPVERVTFSTSTVTELQDVTEAVSRERVVVEPIRARPEPTA